MTTPEYSEWLIRPAYVDPSEVGGDPEVSGWYLYHEPCDWESNHQFRGDRRTMTDVLRWIDNHQCAPAREHALMWGQVPVGWEVLAPDGKWYLVTSTRRVGDLQDVTIAGVGLHHRNPRGLVTARGFTPAIEALGFPEVLEDGP